MQLILDNMSPMCLLNAAVDESDVATETPNVLRELGSASFRPDGNAIDLGNLLTT